MTTKTMNRNADRLIREVSSRIAGNEDICSSDAGDLLSDIEGFQFLSAGASRAAFRRGRYVYKVEYRALAGSHWGDCFQSDDEWTNFLELLSGNIALPEGVFIPEFRRVDHELGIVLIVDYVKGRPGHWWEDRWYDMPAGSVRTRFKRRASEIEKRCGMLNNVLGMCDLYYDNVRVKGDEIWLLDLAM